MYRQKANTELKRILKNSLLILKSSRKEQQEKKNRLDKQKINGKIYF